MVSPPIRLAPANLLAPVALAAAMLAGCASARPPASPPSLRVALLTPIDRGPVRSRDALVSTPEILDMEQARSATLLGLRGDLAAALRAKGLAVVEIDAPSATTRADAKQLSALARNAGAGVALSPDIYAYGDIPRRWLWILAAQALAAGIGHGVVVAAATGNSTYGWWAGAGEFALESATWVGGALVGSRGLDPVLARFTLVRASDGKVLKRWTREGTRPLKRWFRREGEPPRDQRLRAVADRVFERFAPRLLRRLAREDVAATKQPASARPGGRG